MFKDQLKFLIGIFAAALLLGMITGCTKEKCVVCPPDQGPAEKEYHFLYCYVDTGHWVYKYSTRDGHAVDSVRYGHYQFNDVRFSKDGRYAYYSMIGGGIFNVPRATWVTDYATGDTLSIVYGRGGDWISVSPDEEYIVVSGSTGLTIFHVPDLTTIYQGGDCNRGAVNPFKNVAYVPNWPQDTLLILDFQQPSGVTVSKTPLRNVQGQSVSAVGASVTLDGRFVILDAGLLPAGSGIKYIQVRDSETLELLYEYRTRASVGPLHPDGQRLFCYEWFDIYERTGLSALWVLNLRTFLMTRVLTSDDVRTAYPYYCALDLKQVEISPDGRFALLLNSDGFIADGPILKLDLDTYKIVDAFYPRWPAGARLLRIYPLEIKGVN
jgi:hypothetical protein